MNASRQPTRMPSPVDCSDTPAFGYWIDEDVFVRFQADAADWDAIRDTWCSIRRAWGGEPDVGSAEFPLSPVSR